MSEVDSASWDESPDSPAAVSDGETPLVAPPAVTPDAGPVPAPPGPDDDEGDETGVDGVRDAKGRFRSRPSRAKSQDALPEDRPRIKELTRRLRTVEQELAAERQARTAPAVAAPMFDVPTVPTAEFTDPEPTLEEFADKDDPYGAWQRALAKYDRRKEDHERVRAHQTQHVQRLSQESQQHLQQAAMSHAHRLVQAEQARPGVSQVLQQAQARLAGPVPPVLDWSIVLDNDSVDIALFLATHPAILDEFVLMTAVQPVTEQTVAATRRLLRQRMSAVGSGAVAPSQPLPPAPRPPTPLRTAQMTVGDAPPGDDDSVEAHERYYGKSRRSFRR